MLDAPTHALPAAETPLDAIILEPLPRRRGAFDWDNPAKMPERFGMGMLLALMAATSVGFYVLQLIATPPEVVFFFTLLFTAIGVAQMLFPKSPRQASVWAGVIYCACWSLAYYIILLRNEPALAWVQRNIGLAPLVLLIAAGGALAGYTSGGLVAGVFLLLGWRREAERHADESPGLGEARQAAPG